MARTGPQGLRHRLLASALTVVVLGTAACGSTTSTASQPSQSSAPAPAAQVAGSQSIIAPAGSGSDLAPTGGSTAIQSMTKYNLNTITREQVLSIPNAGNQMVREFMEYQPYTSILQFRREIGKYVSQDVVAGYEQYVYVPVDPNTADAETLQQIPGVTPTVASDLVAGRPYLSVDAFVAKLSQSVGPDQGSMARSYLASS